MKRIFTFLLSVFFLSVGKCFSQADSCVVLGCAADYGTQTTNNALPDLTGGFPGSCYPVSTYKQIFWQFLYVDPLNGTFQDYAQTFTPGPAAVGLDIDWVIYEIGTTPPASVHCWMRPSTSGQEVL